MLYSRSGPHWPAKALREVPDVAGRDVSLVGARVDGHASGAGANHDARRFDDARHRAPPRVADGRDLVDVDAEAHPPQRFVQPAARL